MVCGHSTHCTVFALSVNGVLLPCGLGRLRNNDSSSVAEDRYVSLLSLALSVMLTHNYHVITLLLSFVKNTILLTKLYTEKQFRNNQNF